MTVQLISSRKHISLGGFHSFSSNFGIEQASLCREQSVYSRSQLCVGTGSESGALQREVRGVFWAMVMGVSVNNGAVGGGFGSAFDPAVETNAWWLMREQSVFWVFLCSFSQMPAHLCFRCERGMHCCIVCISIHAGFLKAGCPLNIQSKQCKCGCVSVLFICINMDL